VFWLRVCALLSLGGGSVAAAVSGTDTPTPVSVQPAAPAPAGMDEDKSFADSMEMWRYVQDLIRPVCGRYLARFSSEAEHAKWSKRTSDLIAQRIQDGRAGDEGSLLQSLALDWAAGNERKIRRKEPKAVKEACFMFDRFIRAGVAPPWQMREQLTIRNVRKFICELEVTIAASEKGASAEDAHRVRPPASPASTAASSQP
jgi:hypothetical protein